MNVILNRFRVWLVLVLCLPAAPVLAQAIDPDLPPPPALLSISAPVPGETFAPGSPILIQATAVDPLGAVMRLEILADGRKIGVSEILALKPVEPGQLVFHEWVWKDAPAGPHILTVRAVSSQGATVESNPVDILVGSKTESTIRMQSPAAGAVFLTPGRIPMSVVTVDPKSEIRRVEFMAGEKSLGVAEILTRDMILPGRPRVLSLTWTNPPVGKHELWARGKDSSNLEVRSKPVPIEVKDSANGGVPVVTVVATQTPLWEMGELKDRVGSFEFRRQGGRVDQALAVFFKLGGEAVLGGDYRLLQPVGLPINASGTAMPFGTVWFPSGAETVRLGIEALNDKALEGSEAVVLTVVESPLMMPMLSPLPVGDYKVGTPFDARLDINDGAPARNSLVIISPEDGARFNLGTEVSITAVGIGTGTPVTTVEFLANGVSIGKDCFVCRVDGVFPPGTAVRNSIRWTPPKEGRYTLTAVGEFPDGESVKAAPVTIDVGTPPLVPTLSIVRPESGTVVSPKEILKVVAVGVGRAGGITDVELLMDGESIAESHLTFFRPPEADEPVEHAFEVRIPQGDHVLRVRDLADREVISEAVKVRSVLVDVGGVIRWVSPASGSRFAEGRTIPLVVEAMDPDGLVWEVDFYSGEQKIGTSRWSCPECRMLPGATLTHRLEWKGAPAGAHILRAESIRADGTRIVSAKIQVEVVRTLGVSLSAVRDLPDAVVPDQPFTVRIAVKPGDGVKNYVVEEHPPFVQVGGAPPPEGKPRWVVTAVGSGGVFDAANGAVKFGPFFDAEPRTLTYEITPNVLPPEGAKFAGRAYADGASVEIGGDSLLMGARQHPADNSPADDSISAAELTSYGAAWKEGKGWSVGPVPIPADYVTRAAFLWRSGEHYRFDPSVGEPPLCWVSDPRLPPVPVAEAAAADLNGQPRYRGVALRRSERTGTETQVAVRVMPAPGTRAYAVEERFAGVASGVTEGGTVDSTRGVIRWGPFLDSNPRELEYRLDGVAEGAGIRGLASFDGASVRVFEVGRPMNAGPRLVCVEEVPGGGRQVVMEDAAMAEGAEFELQVSTDLRNWRRAGGFVPAANAGFARDDEASGGAPVFYRAVRIQ